MVAWMTVLSQKIREYQAINLNVFENAKPEKNLFPPTNPTDPNNPITENQVIKFSETFLILNRLQ